ncbi:MAG: four helix bundle protein [Bacteroidetes bacterium]|nr:MAG: four helix bundle protein [Bacteroidota bacterium]
MTPEELKNRTKRFAIESIYLVRELNKSPEAWVVGKQFLRSATSVAANYRAACRARSDQEFAAKIGIVVEEADESAFWLEIMTEAEISTGEPAQKLEKEANELTAIMNATRHSVLKRLGRK